MMAVERRWLPIPVHIAAGTCVVKLVVRVMDVRSFLCGPEARYESWVMADQITLTVMLVDGRPLSSYV